MILMTVGILLVSLSLTYAWWTKVRVICLRQDIYDIRDELFDRALKLDGLSDPAYKQARERLNASASVADVFSLITLAKMKSMDISVDDAFCSTNKELQDAIDESLRKCSIRICRFLLRETLSGVFISLLAKVWKSKRQSKSQTSDSVNRWVSSPSPERLQSTLRRKDGSSNHWLGNKTARTDPSGSADFVVSSERLLAGQVRAKTLQETSGPIPAFRQR